MERSNNVGGYSNKFVDAIVNEDFMCRICYLPSRDAQLSECCGHTFCASCLNEMESTSPNSSKCPVCRFEDFETFSNKQIDRKIRSLKAYCSNKDKGCKWLGEINDVQNHLESDEGCEFEEVKCPEWCGILVQRRYLADHAENDCPLRVVECQYCHIKGPYKFVTHEHNKICLKVPVDCPNHCDVENILREDLDEHRKVCSLEMVSCKYMKLGCDARIARKEEEEHRKEKMEEHLQLTNDRLVRLENLVTQVTDDLKTMWCHHLYAMAKCASAGNQITPVIMRMNDVVQHMAYKEKWHSPTFYTHDKGYKMSVAICPGLPNLTVMCFTRYGKYDDSVVWPLQGTFEVTLMNQTSDRKHHSVMIKYDSRVKRHPAARRVGSLADGIEMHRDGWGDVLISLKDLFIFTPECQYYKDDCIYVKVTFIPSCVL